jgi:hypothetical protein
MSNPFVVLTSGETGANSLNDVNSNFAQAVSRRVVAVTQAAAPAINTDLIEIASITGLAQAITSMTTNLTGTPSAGQLLMIQITDNATPRAITWGAKFASTTVTLPVTTVTSTMLRIGFQYNGVTTVWDCVGVI